MVDFEKMTYKELTAKTLLEIVGSDESNYYFIATSAGVILGLWDISQANDSLPNVLVLHDVVFKGNSGVVFQMPEMFVFTDQIVVFHSVSEPTYQRLLYLLQCENLRGNESKD